jgi:hypothetical protein
MNRTKWPVVVCVAAVTLFPLVSEAQSSATSFDELRPLSRPGQDVVVRHVDVLRTLVPTLGVCQPAGAQNANRPFAQVGCYLRVRNTTAAQAAVDQDAPVGSLGALSTRVKTRERIYVRQTSGKEIVGRFSRASEEWLTLEIDGQTREISARDVHEVRRRSGNKVRKGMLYGSTIGGAVGLIATAASENRASDWSRRDRLLGNAMLAALAGLIDGAIIGAFIHERPVVYQAARP